LKGFRKEAKSLGTQPQETKPSQKSNAFKDLPQRRWQTQGRLALGSSTAVPDFPVLECLLHISPVQG